MHHIDESKSQLGEDCAVVCVMSGDFVQRGEAAMYSKFARAEAACRCGADLVVELPVPWALSSAEGFARGAVGLLGTLGADYLSFGSESGEVTALAELADILMDDRVYTIIKETQQQDGTLSFAAARQLAAEKLAGDRAGLLATPNNILAVEYIKAIRTQGLALRPITVKRIGSAHDSTSQQPVRSASELRKMLGLSENISAFVPGEANMVYERERQEGRELRDKDNYEIAMLSRLRMLERDAFHALPDCADGLADRLYAAVRESASLDELFSLAKTKRYAMARVRRACVCAALGIKTGMNDGIPPYARVLAANEKGCTLLRALADEAGLPIITKAAHIKTLSPKCTDMFALGVRANELHSLCFTAKIQRKAGQDWRTAPIIVKNR